MVEILKDKYDAVKYLLDYVAGDKIFAYSIIENRQSGKVYVDNEYEIKRAFFWHNCGYSILAAEKICDESIAFVMDLFNGKHPSSGKGQVLHVSNSDLNHKIEQKIVKDKSIRVGKRLHYRFNRSRYAKKEFPIPSEYRIEQINYPLYQKIKGNVTPAFSWISSDEFINNGVGFCVIGEEEILSWGFTWFIGNGQADIGVETPPKYRKNGLAKIIASAMIDYYLENDLEPVWTCVDKNIISQKLAISLGFELVGGNTYYYRLER